MKIKPNRDPYIFCILARSECCGVSYVLDIAKTYEEAEAIVEQLPLPSYKYRIEGISKYNDDEDKSYAIHQLWFAKNQAEDDAKDYGVSQIDCYPCELRAYRTDAGDISFSIFHRDTELPKSWHCLLSIGDGVEEAKEQAKDDLERKEKLSKGKEVTYVK